MNLSDYVMCHVERGACRCGRCEDAPNYPEKHQPQADTLEEKVANELAGENLHTVNLTFFEVKAVNDPKKEEFLALVKAEFPQWLDSKEHGYLEVGADVGDQGLALMTIGLGGLVKAWDVLSPETVMPFLPPELKMTMAERGLVCLQARGAVDS